MTPNDQRKAAFRQRTKAFASSVIRFYVALDKQREEVRVIGKQLLRSGTSVAANYRESSRSRSVEEFVAKAELCAQEADESQMWLELLHENCAVPEKAVAPVWREANELIAIFVTMAKNAKDRRDRP
jgi:four helix bundle protein